MAFREVIQSGWFILGQQVESLEHEFANWLGIEHAIGVANGTDAIELCLRACGVGKGDLVIVPTHTAVATATAVVRAGAEPLLLDIDVQNLNLDLDQVADALCSSFSTRIKAIVPVHLYGNPCDMTAIMSLAREHEVLVIEDCSQAHGAKWQGQNVGTFGAAAALSCYPTKNLAALGDAGLCVTRSAATAERIRSLRQYGWQKRYVSEEVGMNSRLDELHAAMLRVQLNHLDADNAARKRIADHYGRELGEIPISIPQTAQFATHAFHQFTILTSAEYREPLRLHMKSKGVLASVLYPTPIHLQPAYEAIALKYSFGRSVSEQACERLLCLPIHPFLEEAEIDRVVEAIKSFFQHRNL
jgi:dTDP-4-amino-4,6-dideoxygalactose transaminase